MKRLFLAVLPAILLGGMLALPAHAGGPSHIGVPLLGGRAGVGTNYDPGKECTKQGLGAGDVKGKGLRAPGFENAGDNGRRVWTIDIPILDVPWGVGTLRACGKLKGVFGGAKAGGMQFGAWCGLSKGYDGQGKLQPDVKKVHPNGSGLSEIQLTNLTWKFSGFGMLYIKGSWEEVPKPSKAKGKANSPRGKVWAVFNAQGAGPCVKPGESATSFSMVGGVYWLAPDALTPAKGKKWNDKGPVKANGCRFFEKRNDCWYKAKQ